MNVDNNDSRLTRYVEQNGGKDIDTLSLEEQETAEMKLEKAVSMDLRGIEDRAETLRQEVADMLGVQDEDSTDTDTLSKETVAEYLNDYTLDTLNAKHRIEEEIETLESKITSFKNRDMNKRVKELQDEITVLEGAKSEVDKSKKKYEDIDTLAGRVVSDKKVLEATFTEDGVDLSSRDTGETVVLKESGSDKDVDTLARPMDPRQVNQAVNRVVDNSIRGNR